MGVSGEPARILARKSVSASWNASLTALGCMTRFRTVYTVWIERVVCETGERTEKQRNRQTDTHIHVDKVVSLHPSLQRSKNPGCTLKPAFHDADTDILARIVA